MHVWNVRLQNMSDLHTSIIKSGLHVFKIKQEKFKTSEVNAEFENAS